MALAVRQAYYTGCAALLLRGVCFHVQHRVPKRGGALCRIVCKRSALLVVCQRLLVPVQLRALVLQVHHARQRGCLLQTHTAGLGPQHFL